MPSCIFFFPNLLSDAQELGLDSLAVPEPFSSLFEGEAPPVCRSLLPAPELAGYASLQWIWMRLTGASDLLPFAPYLWKGLGGPDLGKQIWHLAPFHRKDGTLRPISLNLDEDQECLLRDVLNPVFFSSGFEPQFLGNSVFGARKKDLDAEANPWPAQKACPPVPPAGPDALLLSAAQDKIAEALEISELNAYRRENSLTPIEGFWISGGGRQQRIFPPSTFRCVFSSNPIIRGICDAGGISNNFVKSLQDTWGGCPPGDRLAVFDSSEFSGARDSAAKLLDSLEAAGHTIQKLVAELEPDQKYTIDFVASGPQKISFFRTNAGKSKFKFWKKTQNFCSSWLSGRETR